MDIKAFKKEKNVMNHTLVLTGEQRTNVGIERDRHLFFGLCAVSRAPRAVKVIFLNHKSMMAVLSEAPHQPQAKV